MADVNIAKSSTLPLKVWDKIEIIVDSGDNTKQGVYTSRIEEINEEWMITSRPDFVGGNQLLSDGQYVYVQFNMPDALYRFGARIKSLGAEHQNSIAISNFGKMERVQRREFVRINLRLEMQYCLVKKSGENIKYGPWKQARSTNFSAGGMLFPSNEDIGKDDIILIRIKDYGAGDSILPHLLLASCRRVLKIEDEEFTGVMFIVKEKLHEYFTSKEFIDLPLHVDKFTLHMREKMVYYVFEEQINQRQKGLL